MSIIKDLWEIWQLLRQHQRMAKDIEEINRNFNELYNRIFNPSPTISKKENVMITPPYLDTEEKLREFTRKTWHINIEPYHISAQVDRQGNVTIFPSYSYKMIYQQLNCTNLNHGTISVEQISFVHPCVLPVLEEAYRKKEEEDDLKQNALSEEARICFKQQRERSFNIAIARNEQENQRLQEEIEAMQNYHPSSHPSLLNRISNFFKRNQK